VAQARAVVGLFDAVGPEGDATSTEQPAVDLGDGVLAHQQSQVTLIAPLAATGRGSVVRREAP
jgi:hypothetical protein